MTNPRPAIDRLQQIAQKAEAQCRKGAAAQSRFHDHTPAEADQAVRDFIAKEQVRVPLADLLALLEVAREPAA